MCVRVRRELSIQVALLNARTERRPTDVSVPPACGHLLVTDDAAKRPAAIPARSALALTESVRNDERAR